jgi:hypothetical protein
MGSGSGAEDAAAFAGAFASGWGWEPCEPCGAGGVGEVGGVGDCVPSGYGGITVSCPGLTWLTGTPPRRRTCKRLAIRASAEVGYGSRI